MIVLSVAGKKLFDKRKAKMDQEVKRQVDREMKGRLKKFQT